jgi:hypothetical protein
MLFVVLKMPHTKTDKQMEPKAQYKTQTPTQSV